MHPNVQKYLEFPLFARMVRSQNLLFTLDSKGTVDWVYGLDRHTERHLAVKRVSVRNSVAGAS